jgi:hypothetical protein
MDINEKDGATGNANAVELSWIVHRVPRPMTTPITS